MKLVTVFNTFNPAEAQLLNSQLQAAGFHSMVTGELSALSIEGYSMASGGIRVQVPEVEAEDARTLIESNPTDASEEPGNN